MMWLSNHILLLRDSYKMSLGLIATLSSLEDNNITAYIQKIGRGLDWFAYEETSCMNYSINFINVCNSDHFNEVTECGIFLYLTSIELLAIFIRI